MSTEHETEQEMQQQSQDSSHLPNGSAAAALLAGGIGSGVYGLTVVAAEASSGVAQALNLVEGVGPLSGKVLVGVVIWLVVWIILAKMWGLKEVDFRRITTVSVVLVLVGFLLTFPPVVQAFAG